MLNFRSMLVFSENPGALVEFYKKVFQTDPNWEGGDFKGFKVGSGEIAFGPHGKVKGKTTNPERIMFNLETEDVKGEFERIKGLGATVIAAPYQPEEEKDVWVSTFSDPDGNFFQIMSVWKT